MDEIEFEEKPGRKVERKPKRQKLERDDDFPLRMKEQGESQATSFGGDPDIITGKVKKVLDGATFELHITKQEYENQYVYQKVEKVRLQGVDAHATSEEEAKEMLEELTEQILDQTIECEIHGRDRKNVLLVTYELL